MVECLYTPRLYGILSRHADLKRLLRRSRGARWNCAELNRALNSISLCTLVDDAPVSSIPIFHRNKEAVSGAL